MEMLTKERLQNLRVNERVSGTVLVKDYNVQLTKANKEYIVGSIQSGIIMPFKAWGSSSAFMDLKQGNYKNVTTHIVGNVDNYGGSLSLVLDSVQPDGSYTPDQFLEKVYDVEAYYTALHTLLQKKLTEQGYSLCDKILFSNEDLLSRFKTEFAAKSHHDNCLGGLLAHTYKVVMLINNITIMYPKLTKRIDTDLLYIGALLHDIGKVEEMYLGVYQPNSVVTHRYLGVEFIQPYKSGIIKNYSEKWYYDLVSILLQHHGDFGDPCRSVVAYIIHKADMFDSDMTLLGQTLESSDSLETVKVNDSYLQI